MAKKPKPPKPPYRVVLWSGGKDSTATLILAHEKGEPIDLVLMSLMWFDKKRGIPAENKKHLAWVMNYAKPLIESWGYKVKFVSSDKDYIYWFYKIRQSSEMHPETIGKYYGFVLGGGRVRCKEKKRCRHNGTCASSERNTTSQNTAASASTNQTAWQSSTQEKDNAHSWKKNG